MNEASQVSIFAAIIATVLSGVLIVYAFLRIRASSKAIRAQGAIIESLRIAHAGLEERLGSRLQQIARQTAAMEMSADGMAIVERDRLVYANPSFSRIFGFDRAELISRPLSELLDENEAGYLDERVAGGLEESRRWRGNVVGRRKNGPLVNLDLDMSMMPGGVRVLTCRDVSLLEQQALEIEQLYNLAPGGNHSLDPDGNITRINDLELRWLGLERAEVLGRSFLSFVDERYRNKLETKVRTTDGREEISWTEIEIIRVDGGRMPVLLSATAQRNSDGKLVQVHCTLVDISERKRAEEEVMLAARMKGEFLANMSHELRTPLNAILGLSEVMRDGGLGESNPKQLKAASIIHKSGGHLLAMINDMLDLSRMEGRQLVLARSEVSIEEICASSIDVVRQIAEKQRIEVIYESSVGTAMIHADARRLEQCLVKLLSNAAKFTPPGGRIGLNVKIDSLEGSLMIVVWDTGIGISEADQAQLFQPFFQASSGSVRRYDGTGLGLSLTKKLVELHGGTLHVESSIGQGSQFEISLPWEDPRAIAATTLQGPKRRTSNPASNQPLALIVDDNALSIEPVCQYLEAKGYSIAFTRTGPGAMDIIRMRQPAVIFMDIQMPHVLGFDTIRQLRSNPTSARIPIIAVAGFSEPGKREKCLEVGADDYVAKPVVLRDVGTMLRRLVMETSRLN